ncbi:MAG: hypothetical protein ACI31G_00055 [Bacilli bacterium]
MSKLKILSISTLILTLLSIVSLSCSLAFFFNATRLYIDGYDFLINTDKEIKLSLDKENNYSELSQDQLLSETIFTPVSSSYSSTWLTDPNIDTPQFRKNYSDIDAVSHLDSGIASSGFYSQTMYLYSEHNIRSVTISSELTTIKEDAIKNQNTYNQYHELYPSLTLEGLNNIKKSIRISLLTFEDDGLKKYYIIDPYKEEETYFYGRLDNDADGYYDYTSDNKEIMFGEYEGSLVYEEAQEEDTNIDSPLTIFSSNTKKGIQKVSPGNDFVAKKEDSLTLKEAEREINIPLLGKQYKKIVLSIYLEGWDLDNYDYSRFGSFIININFKIKEG